MYGINLSYELCETLRDYLGCKNSSSGLEDCENVMGRPFIPFEKGYEFVRAITRTIDEKVSLNVGS